MLRELGVGGQPLDTEAKIDEIKAGTEPQRELVWKPFSS
jgi:hypothetical protein